MHHIKSIKMFVVNHMGLVQLALWFSLYNYFQFQSSFWFAAGIEADKVTLTQLNDAVNTYFVADIIERFVQRLNAQSATASRLDIPLNEFRDHKYNQVLTTTAITLS